MDKIVTTEGRRHIRWFRNTAPYINAHRGKTFVLMFGGEVARHENFRAYEGWEQGIEDYVNFLSQPRYQAVQEAWHDPHEFADALQQAGYATDPNYADKLKRVIDRMLDGAAE